MILDCPSCRTRYLVHIAHFAGNGRQVRCARCKYQWQATLPTTIDVFSPAQPSPDYQSPLSTASPPSVEAMNPAEHPPTYLVPALIKNWNWRPFLKVIIIVIAVLSLFFLVFALSRQVIVNKFPNLKGLYESVGLTFDHSGEGLMFDQVKSELKYDGGTMRLIVDGIVHNNTTSLQIIPNIKARALGPDGHIIQSWWVEAPAATIEAGSDVPFHTEVNAPMKQTIENVNLQFYDQDEQGNVAQ